MQGCKYASVKLDHIQIIPACNDSGFDTTASFLNAQIKGHQKMKTNEVVSDNRHR